MRHLNGHRGAFLLLFGVAYACLGYSLALVPAEAGRHSALAWMVDVIPINVCGFLWCGAAAAGICSAFLPTGRDRFGFAVLTFVPFAWGGCFAVAWLVSGVPHAWASTVLYWSLAAAVMVVAGMLNRPGKGAV